MSKMIKNPEQAVAKIIDFVRKTLAQADKNRVVVAVSGGIDSALSLTLVTWAMGRDKVFPVFLPYDKQEMSDALALANWLEIPADQCSEINIKPIVHAFKRQLIWKKTQNEAKVRLGNIMARSRMVIIYDLARQLDALVAGTENLSEHYLGYFTRFGDEASDFEPIQHLLKSEVRELAMYLGLPDVFLTKAPSAGLWSGQTDESELGFTYAEADLVIKNLIIGNKTVSQFAKTSKIDRVIIEKVLARIKSQKFKHEVPYRLK